MSEFKKFLVVWLSVVILGAVLTAGALRILSTKQEQMEQNNRTTEDSNHFSVVYRGFIPGYSTTYPDYYITINGLKDDPLRMYIQLYLQNQEASGYYFMIDKYQTPPTGWTINPSFPGYIGVDGTMTYTYSNVYRDKPASITEGELVETINLAVKAYYDSSYTNFYSQDNFTVTYHLVDRASAIWTILDYDSFDDGSTEGWSGSYNVGASTDYYRSFRYSLRVGAAGISSSHELYKSFSIGPPYSGGYLVSAIRSPSYPDFTIYIDGSIYFKPDVGPAVNAWNEITIPLHYGDVSVKISWGYFSAATYMDDVYVIVK